MNNEAAIHILLNSNEYHHAKGDLPHSAASIEAFNKAIDALKNAPTDEITEEQAINKLHETGWLIRHDKEMTTRPQGEWEHDKLFGECAYVCSFCHTIWTTSEIQNMHYCPTCGADMRKGDEQENSQEESSNVDWDKPSSEQEESEKSNNTTFNGIYDLNDGIADPSYINEFVDCSDLGIYPWGTS